MSKKFDYKKRLRANQIRKFHYTKRVITLTAIASLVLFSPLSLNLNSSTIDSYKNVLSTNYAEAASLAEVQLLTDVTIQANLSDSADPTLYDLGLILEGTGLADAEILSPDRTVIFYIPELAGKLHKDSNADVTVEILPITMDDLPTVNGSVNTLTGSLTDLVIGLTTTLTENIEGSAIDGLVQVNGLTDLNNAIDNLNNLNIALANILSYENIDEVTALPNGVVMVNFTDGLGNHVESLVKSEIEDTLTELLNVVEGIEIVLTDMFPAFDILLNNLVINPILNTLRPPVVTALNSLLTDISDDAVNLSNELAGLQILGETTVVLNVYVEKPANVTDPEVTVFGAGVSTTTIDLELLNDINDQDTIIF